MNKQINLRLSESMLKTAKEYAEAHGFSNVQELIKETMRRLLYANHEFTQAELDYIDRVAEENEKNNDYLTAEETAELLR